MASELRAVMPVDLFMAAVEGNRDILIPRLGLQSQETTDQIQMTIEPTHSSPEQIKTELQSATGFGDTVLHVLVTYGHNVLALKVFQRDRSLLNAQNKMSETPMHCAAKVGNRVFISNLFRIDPVIVKDAIKEIDENGDAPFHVAAKHGHVDVIRKLMEWDPKIAHRDNTPKIAHRVDNNEMLCPLYIAIMKNHTRMVKEMLNVDPTLAYIPFSDGMFPVHVSASMGNIELVKHFIEQYPKCAKLLDPRGRNLFHIAAEKNQTKFFTYVSKCIELDEMRARMNNSRMKAIWEKMIIAEMYNEGLTPLELSVRQMIAAMNNATDNEGNTPLHIAAMKGHKSIMKAIWEKKMGIDAEHIRNNDGLTPFQLSLRQLETNEDIKDVESYIKLHVTFNGSKFTREWFDVVMNPEATKDKSEEIQYLGVGSVLIITVTFAAAFTIPGGYNQNNGTPILGKKYMFRAFIVANTFAFLQGFASLLFHFFGKISFDFAEFSFLLAASSMVVAFGLGTYVTLAPICYPLAVLVLVITLITGSPLGIFFNAGLEPIIMKYCINSRLKTPESRDCFKLVLLVILFPLIFCLAFL